MDDIKRILVVSRMTKYCLKAVQYGVSLAKKYNAELYVIHAVHNPFLLEGWNLGSLSLEEEYQWTLQQAKKDMDDVIALAQEDGTAVKELIRKGEPTEEILRAVTDENIDLIIMLAHEEGRLEHFLFGRSNEDIVRKMPCSVLLVKKEPGPVAD